MSRTVLASVVLLAWLAVGGWDPMVDMGYMGAGYVTSESVSVAVAQATIDPLRDTRF